MLRVHGGPCLGQGFPVEVVNEELAAVARGNPNPRAGDDARVFEIYDADDRLCGDVTLTDGWGGYTEVSVLVFDRCSGRGVASDALARVVQLLAVDAPPRLEASVLLTSPNRPKMDRILRKLRFVPLPESPPTVVYRYPR